jgi:hypothetical protein
MTGSAVRTWFYRIAFWVIAIGSVSAGFYLAATDRLLLGSAVMIVSCVPMGLLLLVLRPREPWWSDAEKVVTVRRLGRAFVVTGAAAVVIGGVLMLALHGTAGHLPELLLWNGAALLVAGASTFQHLRARVRE